MSQDIWTTSQGGVRLNTVFIHLDVHEQENCYLAICHTRIPGKILTMAYHVFMVFDGWTWTTMVIHQIPSSTMDKWPWSIIVIKLTMLDYGQRWWTIVADCWTMVAHTGTRPWSVIVDHGSRAPVLREYDEPMDPSNGEMEGQFPEYLRAIQVLGKEIISLLISKNMLDVIWRDFLVGGHLQDLGFT